MKSKLFGVSFNILFLCLLANSLQAQEKSRSIKGGMSFEGQPIEIIARELDDRPVVDEARVLAGPDWWKHIVLTIRNVSDKHIAGFDIVLWTEKKDRGVSRSYAIPIWFRTYTKETEMNALTPQGEKKLGVLQPGETIKVRVNDSNAAKFGDVMKKDGTAEIDFVEIDMKMVVFADGTRWMFGKDLPPDTPR